MRAVIIGASTNRAKFGNKAVRAYLRQGHTVLPVNPSATTIEGVTAYATIDAVPGPIDRALFYVHPEVGITLLDAIAARADVGEIWLNPGSESEPLIAKAKSLGLMTILACSIIDIGERPA